jgi:hypothetical protein
MRIIEHLNDDLSALAARIERVTDTRRRGWLADALAAATDPVDDEPPATEAGWIAAAGTEVVLSAHEAAEVLMDREGLSHLYEQFTGTDRLWLLNRLRCVVDRFLAWNPSHDPILGAIGRDGPTLHNEAFILFGHLAAYPETCAIFSPGPDGHGLHPYRFHELLKADHEHLKGLCDFGIHADCGNRMDHLLVFPSGSSLVWFAACGECAEELRFWI